MYAEHGILYRLMKYVICICIVYAWNKINESICMNWKHETCEKDIRICISECMC